MATRRQRAAARRNLRHARAARSGTGRPRRRKRARRRGGWLV